MKPFAIGIDIGGTHLRLGAVTPEGQVEHFEKSPAKTFGRGMDRPT